MSYYIILIHTISHQHLQFYINNFTHISYSFTILHTHTPHNSTHTPQFNTPTQNFTHIYQLYLTNLSQFNIHNHITNFDQDPTHITTTGGIVILVLKFYTHTPLQTLPTHTLFKLHLHTPIHTPLHKPPIHTSLHTPP